MNAHLQHILAILQQADNLPEEQKAAALKALKDADKEFEITAFKLDRTDKVKRTTAILLEETIEELEQKRKSVEAQNRELGIEAALERVRTVAMSMRQPADLIQVCKAVFNELQLLGFPELRNVLIHSYQDKEKFFIDYDYSDFTKGHISTIPYSGNSIIERFIGSIRSSEDAFTELAIKGNDLITWRSFREKNNEAPDDRLANANELYYYFYSVGNASLGISTLSSITDTHQAILKRFRNVFDLAYQRFADISIAEAQARESKIEAALERVRGKALAMQKSDDLSDAVAVVFEEMDKLNLGMLRCGIGILDKEKRTADVFSTTISEGDKVVQVSGDESMDIHPLLKGAFDTWLTGEDHDYILEGDDLVAYYQAVSKTNFQLPESQLIADKNQRQYYFRATFNEGGLFAFRDTPFPEEAKQVMKRFAAVFDLTYKRFLDLQNAEAHARQAEQDLVAIKEAKQKAEEALTELQVTQKQLIQSEKMASLGELTAGIAHEIQNPLNFVNNFSDVSKELLDEMKEAIDRGDTEEAKEIMNDVIQNLEKINHHGKRADGIVKGMLQHSRTGSNQRELIDINALADEYLRLAYHGWRAKDKSFNAKFVTDFDDTIGKINIMSQDIGRVILNLINNAFYAVSQRKKLDETGYEPTVTVRTRKTPGTLEIKVEDNGTGIPSNIKEKIFQPFFTTKPTGQGTGLGLSLAYDIVKAHEGSLSLNSTEGEGTSFIIELPIHQK
jgi:signal transduction histidine kinase